ncbi:MAG: FoF1 ATP synthase subunit gamma [Candidatus Omnitrophota bacterium]
MIPIAKLKDNLQFNKDLGGLIEVMKMAATLQFGQFRSSGGPLTGFSTPLEAVHQIVGSLQIKHMFLNVDESLPSVFILISSNEGFLGDLNFLLVNKLMEVRRTSDEILVLGEQGAEYLEELKVHFSSRALPSDKLEAKEIESLRDEVLTRYKKREIGRVNVVHARFINIGVQQIESEVLLPLPESSTVNEPPKGLIIEPDLDSVLNCWVKLWLGFRFHQIFWSSRLAEYAARIMHLESSLQELKRLNKRLELEYFKYLHGLSDTSIREICASRLTGLH